MGLVQGQAVDRTVLKKYSSQTAFIAFFNEPVNRGTHSLRTCKAWKGISQTVYVT